MEPLDLHIEHEVRIQSNTLVLCHYLAQLFLLLTLDGVELTDHIVIDHGLQLGKLIQVLQEVSAYPVLDQLAQLGVAKTHPATGSDTVGLILEALGVHRVPLGEQVVFQDLGVDLGNTVYIAAHINAQVCHMGSVVIDDEQAGMLAAKLGIQTADDIHDLRHDRAQQIQIPLFQRLTHNGVVGVGEGLLGNTEGAVKVHTFCHQKADQLGDGHSRVGIVQLHGIEVRKVGKVVAVGSLVGAEHILQGCRGQHILLLDTQALAFPGGIVGVKHTGDVFCPVLLGQSPQIVLVVKGIEVQFFLGFTLPQTQGVDIICAVADDRHIIGNCQNGLVSEVDLYGVVIPAVGPGITELCPVVSHFLLAAVGIKALLEKAEAVTQAIAGQRNVGAGGRIQEAGSQTAQAAVTQGGILHIFQDSQVNAALGEELLHFIQNA